MTVRTRRGPGSGLLTLAALAIICSCGGRPSGGVYDAGPDAAAAADAAQADAAPVDAESPDAGPPDAGPPDAEIPAARPFESITSGGATVSSPNYRVELYLAPVPPVATTLSPNYRIHLGPAGQRRP